MKTVLIIVPRLIGHGMERMAVLAAEVLAKDYNTKIIVFTDKKQQYSTYAEIINLNAPSENGILNKVKNVLVRVRKLRKYRKSMGPDVVISFGTSANIVNCLSKGKGKTVISFRGYATVKKGLSFFLTCKLADWVFCISEGLLKHLNELCPSTKKKSSVIYNRSDISEIREKANDAIPYTPSHPAFVAMGRLEPVKGQLHLIKAFAMVVDRIPTASLTIIGEGNERESLIKEISNLGINDKVFLIGSKTNPFPYLKKCDICVATSITEGFMNVLVEAGACGLCAISTDCQAGPREILSENRIGGVLNDIEYAEYGVLVPPFNSNNSNEPQKDELLASAMIELGSNAGLCEKYKRALSNRSESFSIDKYYNDLVSLIERW